MSPKSITREAIMALPLRQYTGPIVLLKDDASAQDAAARLSGAQVVGFDTETRPAFKKGQRYPVALLQLALPDTVYLLRLCEHGLPDCIAAVLSDPSVKKVGIGTLDDVRALRRDFGCEARGVVSMDRIFRQRGYQVTSLRKLTALLLGWRLSKRQQTSNWAAPQLKESQKRYAATDAWASLRLWQHLHAEPEPEPSSGWPDGAPTG